MTQTTEDPVVTSSRREAVFALALWVVTLAYTVGYCHAFGYYRSPDDIRFILGIPDWILWGVFAPWLACTIISSLFAKFVMRDAHIGEDDSSSDAVDRPGTPPAAPPAAEASHG
jgi:uncharacterized membrane protein YhdT